MNLVENSTGIYKNVNHDNFFFLLKDSKIETAINEFFSRDIQIDYNNKKRLIHKKTWIKYLKKSILNKFTEVVQFKIEKADEDEKSSFIIFMICRRLNGALDFTEIQIVNSWEDNYINKMKYNLISH